MRKILFIMLLFQMTLLSAQHGNGGGRGMQNQQSTPEKAPEFNPQNQAGLFFYDENEIVIKTKIEKNVSKKQHVIKLIKNYNNKINELLFLNRGKFETLEQTIATKRKTAMVSKNFEAMEEINSNIYNTINPVRLKVNELETELNSELITVFSEKENKKWISYQKKEKAKLNPTPTNQNNQNYQRQGSGQRRSNY